MLVYLHTVKFQSLLFKRNTVKAVVIRLSLICVPLQKISAYLFHHAHINDLQILGNSTLEENRWRKILNSLPPRQRRGLVPGRNSVLLQQLAEFAKFR